MKRFVTGVVAAVLAASCITGPAFAQPIIIRELVVGPLLGMSSSTAMLQAKVSAHEDRLVAAASELGMHSDETETLLRKVRHHDLQWVEIPRRLDGMAWLTHGHVRVLRDVIIPAKSYGWEIDIPSEHGELFAYLPQECGNLAVIREKVLAAHFVVPVNPQPEEPVHFSFQPDYPDVQAPAPLAYTPDLPSIQAPPTSHSRFPWLLLLPIGIAFFHGGHSSTTPGIPTIPIIPGQPTPPPGPPPPGAFQCWEEPSAHCDATTQSTIRHH
ncbi:MAG: hypothetical protein ACXWNK_00305 [Vulcanimicrobiaceae bacterium]